MEITSCPWCNSSLQRVATTQVCSTCGKAVRPDASIPSHTLQPPEIFEPDRGFTSDGSDSKRGTISGPRRVLSTLPYFSLLRNSFSLHIHALWSNHKAQKRHNERFAEQIAFSMPLTLTPQDEEEFTGAPQDQATEDNDISELRPDGQLTWQKVVEPSLHRQLYTYPPRPSMSEDEQGSERVAVALATAHPSPLSITLPSFKKVTPPGLMQASPRLVFWISIAILLITIGLFSAASAFGQGKTSTTNIDNRLSLQITPNELSVGATMLVRGNHFSPGASIGLTRDNAVPLADTFGAVFTQADLSGQFTDTIFVEDDWGTGTHIITAEDAVKHQVASFPIMIDGKGVSLRPPHLHLSVNSLDFGTGDQATTSTKALTLLNSGNSEIVWQESTSEPWLLMAPTQGIFTSDVSQQVSIAVDRSKLQPGSYTAQVNFSSNGGDESLTVTMNVIPLAPEHDAIMQISPAVLSFTATDGSGTTPAQQIEITNSGGQTMNWQASANVPWLKISPASTTVAPNTFTTVGVSVAARNLLPGTYTGTLTFTAQNVIGNGNAFHSPQQVIVSITITPPCALQVGSSIIDFSSAYLQPAPPSKTIKVTASSGCAAPLNWNATSNTAWLTLNNTHGTTPSVFGIGVNVTGLTPNTYTGTITLSSAAGTQTIVVSFILGPAGSAVISLGPPSLSFNSIAGQAGPTVQTLRLSNTGEGILNWHANTIPNQNINWLQVTPASGTLSSNQATTLTVAVMSSTVLASGNYNGTILLTGDNGAGRAATGSPQSIPISYSIKPACTLQAASTAGLNFSTIAGINPASQSFSIGVTGACNGGVTVAPMVSTADGGNWLSTSPSSATITAGSSVTFAVNVNAGNIATNQHTGMIALVATANGSAIAGSSQGVNVSLEVAAAPFLIATPSTININVPGGNTSSPINIANAGGSPLNWAATLQGGTPAFISLSAAGGSNVAAGANTSFNVFVNANGVASGQYQTTVTISATNAANGQAITGSPAVIPITIVIGQPVMQVDTTNVTFSSFTGGTPAPQSVTITNTGGGILSWTVSSPTQSWLSVNTTGGSTAMGANSTVTFSVQANGMAASSTPYTDHVVITPAVGNPITINVSLTLSLPIIPSFTPVPTIVPTADATPTAMPSPGPTPTASLPILEFDAELRA